MAVNILFRITINKMKIAEKFNKIHPTMKAFGSGTVRF
jgi:hypothetical protein